jgi:hypothetical protein
VVVPSGSSVCDTTTILVRNLFTTTLLIALINVSLRVFLFTVKSVMSKVIYMYI